jgi:hypothetical protein
MATKKKKPTKAASTKPVTALSPLRTGGAVFIRTVTMNHVGRVVALEGDMVVLENASWVADTGARLGQLLETGKFEGQARGEVERTPGVVAIGRGAIVDVYEWKHELPVATQ